MFKEIKELLSKNVDTKYKSFVEKSVPTANNVMGVRLPVLRKIATKICKGDVNDFIENYPCVSYEDKMLMGIVIAQSNISIENKIEYLKNYIPFINDWGTCDTMIATLKLKENELSKVYEFIMDYRYSNKEYELRFLIVTLMYYYLNDEHLDSITEIIDSIHVDYYYTNMATAWLISYMYFANKEYTLNYLKNNDLDTFTYNKALQKIMESKKINKEEKEQIKSMRKK